MTSLRLIAAVGLALTNLLVAASDFEWAPITAADLAENPVANENLRYLDFKVRVIGRDKITRLEESRRVKILTKEGIEKLKETRIFLIRRYDVDQVGARVIHPDGSIASIPNHATIDWTHLEPTELTVADLFDLEGRIAEKDVVDMQWTTRADGIVLAYMCILPPFDSIRSFELRVLDRNWHRLVYAHNAPTAKAENTKHESIIRLENLPPFENVSFFPPVPLVAPIVGFGTAFKENEKEREWDDRARFNLTEFEKETAPGRATRELAQQLMVGASTETEKVERLYRYCNDKILNLNLANSPTKRLEVTERRRARYRWSDQTGAETLEKGVGFGFEIDLAFAALLRAIGLKPRKVYYADSSRVIDPSLPGAWQWMNDSAILVSIDGKDRFASPGNPFMSFGALPSNEQGATALVLGDEATFVRLPVSAPEENRVTRKAQLDLKDNGDLEGRVVFTFTGANARVLRLTKAYSKDQDIELKLLQAHDAMLPDADLSEVEWSNLGSAAEDLQVVFKLKVPGKKNDDGSLRFPAYLFEAGRALIFTQASRQVGLHFPSPYEVLTEVQISYPNNWGIAAKTGGMEVGSAETPFHTTYQTESQPENQRVVFRRHLVVGRQGRRDYPVEAYPAVKRFFEQTQKIDDTVIEFTPLQTGL